MKKRALDSTSDKEPSSKKKKLSETDTQTTSDAATTTKTSKKKKSEKTKSTKKSKKSEKSKSEKKVKKENESEKEEEAVEEEETATSQTIELPLSEIKQQLLYRMIKAVAIQPDVESPTELPTFKLDNSKYVRAAFTQVKFLRSWYHNPNAKTNFHASILGVVPVRICQVMRELAPHFNTRAERKDSQVVRAYIEEKYPGIEQMPPLGENKTVAMDLAFLLSNSAPPPTITTPTTPSPPSTLTTTTTTTSQTPDDHPVVKVEEGQDTSTAVGGQTLATETTTPTPPPESFEVQCVVTLDETSEVENPSKIENENENNERNEEVNLLLEIKGEHEVEIPTVDEKARRKRGRPKKKALPEHLKKRQRQESGGVKEEPRSPSPTRISTTTTTTTSSALSKPVSLRIREILLENPDIDYKSLETKLTQEDFRGDFMGDFQKEYVIAFHKTKKVSEISEILGIPAPRIRELKREETQREIAIASLFDLTMSPPGGASTSRKGTSRSGRSSRSTRASVKVEKLFENAASGSGEE